MTAFQVNPNWYDEYWMRDTNDLTGPQVRRRRRLAIKHAFFAFLAMPIRFFRLAKATHQQPMSALGQKRTTTFCTRSHSAT